MPVDVLLAKLDRVRATGRGRWLACCPAHADKSPSLSLRELEDGRTLLHCFAGCDVAQVLGALDLDVTDLFPDGAIADRKPRERRALFAIDVLRALTTEAIVLVMYARRLARGDEPLQDRDRDRLLLAASRISAALDAYRV